jgi:hypothetical protein
MASLPHFNIALVAQSGRIAYQALLAAASVRRFHSKKDVNIHICIPENTSRWKDDPSVQEPHLREAFEKYECTIKMIDNSDWGSSYPYGNKFYAISSLPADEPFLFLDSDNILIRPIAENDIDFARPALRPAPRPWPIVSEKTPSYGAIWRSLYEFFDLDSTPYHDKSLNDDVRSYPYYNAAIMYYSRAGDFGPAMLEMGKKLWANQPAALEGQPLFPWLDQVVLPLVLAKLGVPRFRRKSSVHNAIVHYRYPYYLVIPYQGAEEAFVEVTRDEYLASVLMHDSAFRYYMSEEGKNLARAVHAASTRENGKVDFEGFRKRMRAVAPETR